MARLDTERQNELGPKRMEYAEEQLKKLGFSYLVHDGNKITFFFKDEKIQLFPFTGWHTGKSIVD